MMTKEPTSTPVVADPTNEIPAPIKQNQGYCHCCRNQVTFESKENWLRDYYLCSACHSIPRQRHIQYILDRFVKGWEGMSVHESSPSNNFIAKYMGSSYSSSHFFDDIPGGEYKDGVRCENLEDMTFPDNTFDIFITQDVFEHIFNPEAAAREIIRVLKPGGAHVFTAPKHKTIPVSYPRARFSEGHIVHLMEEEYHGNPVGDGRSLVTWDYGDDFEFLLQRWTDCPTVTYVTRDENLGIDGEFLEVFVTRKDKVEPK